jgi:hypothetical protein
MASNELRITELDFEQIKSNIKTYLRNQDFFTEYDFEGSGMDVLLDILAYNTHYNAFYINNALNESFLGTAVKRSSVAKRARTLSYVPRSRTASKVNVNLTIVIPQESLESVFGTGGYGLVQLQKFNRFTTSIDNVTYQFVNPEAVTLTNVNATTFTASNVQLVQGIPNTFRYVVNGAETQKFEIPNENVDIETLTVYSEDPNETDAINFSFFKDVNLSDVNSTTPIYFLHENARGFYEVSFGDGIYGRKPVINEEVFLEFIITDGQNANRAGVFETSTTVTLNGNLFNNAVVTVQTSERSSGGAERESIDSIKFNAPRSYQAQERAVVVSDYFNLIKGRFGFVESLIVWGGQDNIPAKYGVVFISAKPFNNLFLTELEKTVIKNFIDEKKIVGLRTEFVDAKYTYIILDSIVNYDSKKTILTQQQVQELIVQTIRNYGRDNINKFGKTFRLSPLVNLIDRSELSIESNVSSIRLQKRFIPELNITRSYTLNFQNSIFYPRVGYQNSIFSSTFTLNGFVDSFLEQTETGTLRASTFIGSTKTTIVDNIGQVDYDNGVVVINNFTPTEVTNGILQINVVPKIPDIGSFREFILLLEDSNINVTINDVSSFGSLTQSQVNTTQNPTTISTSNTVI